MTLAAESVNFGIVSDVISAKEACGILEPVSGNGELYHAQPPYRHHHPFARQKRKKHHQNSSISLTRKSAKINSYLKEGTTIDYINDWR